jgi:hypothetical protein
MKGEYMKISKIATILTLAILSLFQASRVQASEVLFQDNFNDNDFSDWTVVRNFQWGNPSLPCFNNGQPALWEILQGRLGITIDGPSCMTEIIPNNLDLSGHDFLYEFDWLFKESTVMDRVVLFIWKDKDNWYDFKILDDSIQIQKVANGVVHPLEGSFEHYKFSADTSYHFKITVKERNTITLTIDDNEVMEVTDTLPFIDGYKTVGLQAGVGAIRRSLSYFDNILVTNIETDRSIRLNTPLLKQTDPQWRTQIYDSAAAWSQNPTINRWGCALTSMAMIMNHYGLHSLPDGQPLNPGTLNTWLKSQADGYLGEGAINWVAATRLTRLISEKLSTPKLEYRRAAGSSLEAAATEIKAQKPVILHIDGHFMVGDGVTADGSDIFIKDPAYAFDHFSQHHASLVSTRTFQPSQTDLSYLLMTHQPSLTVTITDAQGNSMAGLETFSELIKDPTEGATETSPALIQHQVAQPAAGTYQIKVSQPTFGPFTYQLFAYDKSGNPTILSQEGWVGSDPLTFTLNYSAEAPSTLTQTEINFTSFRRDLAQMSQAGQFKHKVVLTVLDTLARTGEKMPAQLRPAKVVTARVIAKQLEIHQRWVQPSGYAYLQHQIQALIRALTSQR